MTKVSVIMPVYNGEHYIAQAIDSVLLQTWQDWELIIIDDGSTDCTPSVIGSFSDPRIISLQQENAGEARTRNRAIDLARGEYIAFLDADDLYLPNALADMTRYLDGHQEFDIVFADGFFCDEENQPLMRLSDHRPGPYTGNILEPLVLNSSVVTVPVCTMTRSATIRESGVRFDPALTIGPDWDFWIHLARFARFGYLDAATCMYRVHQTNITRTTSRRDRHRDQIYGRLKIMHATWFGDLSIPTREVFFYHLLVILMSGTVAAQKEAIFSLPFQSLPKPTQGRLLRFIATDYLRKHDEWTLARYFLTQSYLIYRGGRTLLLLGISRLGPRVTRTVLDGWGIVRRAKDALGTDAREKRMPVPQGLRPLID